ncbi:iron hydrogenase small subunit [Ferrimonas pelagia]|uniref:Iron hydrogenase small subunit HydB n=1 Tax=Ferrimonas pelagia TaxID=1177826 RepID=A0ABP9EGQ7_9GAMM
MSQKDHQFTESPFFLSRRKFMVVGAAIVAAMAIPVGWFTTRVAKRNEYIKARIAGLYQDDTIATNRFSHHNKAVQQYYREFGGEPLGHTSHKLLHTTYVDRSSKIS